MSEHKPMPLTAEGEAKLREIAASDEVPGLAMMLSQSGYPGVSDYIAKSFYATRAIFATLDAERSARAAAEKRLGFKEAEFETVMAEVTSDCASLARENAELRAVVERQRSMITGLEVAVRNLTAAAEAARTEARNAKPE